MGEQLAVPGRYAVRTPMQWTADDGGGFSTAPTRRFPRSLPDGDYAPARINVADQRRDERSLWHHIRRLSQTYRAQPSLAWAAVEVVALRQRSVLAHVARSDGWAMLALHNLSPEPQTATLRVDADGDPVTFTDRFDGTTIRMSADVDVELGPYGWCWLSLDRPDAAVRRR